jgi:hypothetical protein
MESLRRSETVANHEGSKAIALAPSRAPLDNQDEYGLPLDSQEEIGS